MPKKRALTKPALRSRIVGYREVRAADIVGAEWNFRRHAPNQQAAIAGSIAELGFFDPLDVIDLGQGKFKLFDGHARRDLISDRIGPDTLIPCNVTDLTEDEAKKAMLLKDPLAAQAETDAAALEIRLRPTMRMCKR